MAEYRDAAQKLWLGKKETGIGNTLLSIRVSYNIFNFDAALKFLSLNYSENTA